MLKKTLFSFTLYILILLQLSLRAQDLHGKIVFSTPASPDDSIWSINADGSNKQFITIGNWPRVSPNKSYMAFLRGGQTDKSRNSIYLRNLATMYDTLLVANNDHIVNFDFNPSETVLTFDGYCLIYQISLTGGTTASLPLNTGDCWNDMPRIRPSDSLITFQNLHDGIFASNYDGTNAALVPNTLPGDLDPSWSPGGTWVCFTRDFPGQEYRPHDYFKIHPDGSNFTQITHFPDDDTLGNIGTWSNNELYIVAAARIGGITGIYKIATDSSGETTLLCQLPNQYSAINIAVGNADSVLGIANSIPAILHVSSSINIFPNPAHEFAIASIALNHPSNIKLMLCDESGKAIQTIVDEWMPAGNQTFQFNIRALPNGIYWCRLLAGNENYTAKLVVLN